MPRWSSTLAILALGTLSPRARASPLQDLIAGADGVGGLQARVIPGGASAAYFNPALLADAPPGLALATLVIVQEIGISLDGRPDSSSAVPAGIANAAHADGSAISTLPLPTYELQAKRPRQSAGTGHRLFAYQSVGAIAKLFGQRLTLGFHGIIPIGDFTTFSGFYSDEREQYFSNSLHPELYADRLTSISLAGGFSWRFSDSLAVGVGASLSLLVQADAPTYLSDVSNLDRLVIKTDAGVNVSLSPSFGLTYKPFPRWHLTGAVHAPEEVRIGVDFGFLLPSGLQQGSSFSLVYGYMPWQVSVGTRYELLKSRDRTLTLIGTALYAKWSDYTDRHGENPPPEYRWYDTLTPTAGFRYQLEATTVGLDVQYKRSPVPPQTGRTNYVDNDTLSSGGVLEHRFSVFGTALRIGLQTNAHWLIPRHQSKLPTPPSPDGAIRTPTLVADELPDDSRVGGMPIVGSEGLQTNNPGWPGFGSRGVIFSFGLYMTVVQ